MYIIIYFILQEIIRPHLPAVETSEEELNSYLKNTPELSPITDQTEHPYYHQKPCKKFNNISRLIKHAGLDQAKVLTNTIQIKEGLPVKLLEKLNKVKDIMPQSEDIMKDILLESRVFDATQKKLPRYRSYITKHLYSTKLHLTSKFVTKLFFFLSK